MHRVVSTGIRNHLKVLARKHGPKRAAVAYVASDADVAFQEGDVLVVDACDTNISCGQTDASVLQRAFDRGAEIYSLPKLHGKVFLFGSTAVIGSANLSSSGLIEAGLITDDHVIVAGIASLIDEMTKLAEIVDERFLRRILKIVVSRRGMVAERQRKYSRRIADRGSSTWIVSVKEQKETAFPDEQRVAERGLVLAERRRRDRRNPVTWIRFAGRSAFRSHAIAGDSVIMIYTPRGTKRPRILRPQPILRAQDEESCRRFYVEELRGDAERSLSWTTFGQLVAAIGWGKISKRSVRRVPDEVAANLNRSWPKRFQRLS